MQSVTLVSLALTLALCVGQTLADLPGCKQDIIDKIAGYWDTKGAPTGILAALAKNGQGTLLYSTEGVPVVVPVENPKCVKGDFTPTTAKFTVVPSSGTLDAAKSSVSYKVNEKDGVVLEDGGKVAKYIISNKHGVTCFYTCNPKATDDDDSDSDPTAGLAVSIKKYKSAKKYIAAAKSDMEDLGFDLQTTYPKECTK